MPLINKSKEFSVEEFEKLVGAPFGALNLHLVITSDDRAILKWREEVTIEPGPTSATIEAEVKPVEPVKVSEPEQPPAPKKRVKRSR